MNDVNNFFTIEGRIQGWFSFRGIDDLLEQLHASPLFHDHLGEIAERIAKNSDVDPYSYWHHVAIMIDERLLLGSIETTPEGLPKGDVKMVVSEMNTGALCLHAILQMPEQLLWMSDDTPRTRWDWVAHAQTYWVTLFCFSFLGYIPIFIVENNDPFILVKVFCYTSPLFVLGMGIMIKNALPRGRLTEAVFKALGVPNYKHFDLISYPIPTDFSYCDPCDNNYRHIFEFGTALAAQALPTH